VDPSLEQLAAVHGVATSYDDWSNKPVAVKESAVVAALAGATPQMPAFDPLTGEVVSS